MSDTGRRCGTVRGEARYRRVCTLEPGHAGQHEDRRGPAPVAWGGALSGPTELVAYAPPHSPRRPDWGCRTCGQAWPCQPARDALVHAYGGYGRRDLLGYLAEQVMDADEDLRRLHGDSAPPMLDTFRRFLGWARRPPVNA